MIIIFMEIFYGGVFLEKKRLVIMYIIFLSIFSLLSARLYLIATEHSKASLVLSGQYSRKKEIVSRTGFIFDRNGVILDKKENGFAVIVNPSALVPDKFYDAAKALSDISDKPQSYFIEKIVDGAPFSFKSDKSTETEYAKSFTLYEDTNDVFLRHILGYKNADGIGMSGILGAYNDFLTKKENAAGAVFVRYEADAHGRVLDGGFFNITDSGYSNTDGIYLTIDSETQKIAEKVCSECMDMGAVVVQDTRTGEILASVSMPNYSPASVAQLLSSDDGELLNRAFLGYTPGSVFKTVVAAAALEKDISYKELEYECKGYIDISGEIIKCHNTGGHGKLTMTDAFSQSCNPYFINLGLEIGIDEILETAKKMGVRNYKSINLLPTSAGNLPSENLILPALVANTSVGQGELLLTPIQVSSVISCAATGVYKKPSIVLMTEHSGINAMYGENEGEKILDTETCKALREMLMSCVADGTGHRASSDIIASAGKTATAQSGQIKNGKEVIHSWFAGFFPADDPKYTICVLCDGNGAQNENPSVIFKKIAEGITQNTHR